MTHLTSSVLLSRGVGFYLCYGAQFSIKRFYGLIPDCYTGAGPAGVLLLDGVAASVSGIRMLGTLKDGFDVKGEGTVLPHALSTLPPTLYYFQTWS